MWSSMTTEAIHTISVTEAISNIFVQIFALLLGVGSALLLK